MLRGVFCDETNDVAHYGGYASMLALIDGPDPLRPRVTRTKDPKSNFEWRRQNLLDAELWPIYNVYITKYGLTTWNYRF